MNVRKPYLNSIQIVRTLRIWFVLATLMSAVSIDGRPAFAGHWVVSSTVNGTGKWDQQAGIPSSPGSYYTEDNESVWSGGTKSSQTVTSFDPNGKLTTTVNNDYNLWWFSGTSAPGYVDDRLIKQYSPTLTWIPDYAGDQPPSMVFVQETGAAVGYYYPPQGFSVAADNGFGDLASVDPFYSTAFGGSGGSFGTHYTAVANPNHSSVLTLPDRVLTFDAHWLPLFNPASWESTGWFAEYYYTATVSSCFGGVQVQATAGSPAMPQQTVTFGSVAIDCSSPNSSISYTWDFGDTSGFTAGQNVTHAYQYPGIYTATVLATSSSGGSGTATVQVQVLNVPLRDPSPGKNCPYCGNAADGTSEPTATRGLPLGYDVTLNTQTVEANRVMGNATFTYDMHVTTQSIKDDSGVVASHWMVVDGTGERLDFGLAAGNPTQTHGIFSSLAVQTSGSVITGFTLGNAGPPGAVSVAGNFQYNFDGAGNLTAIHDPNNNIQSLAYSGSHLSSVTDMSTGHVLTFGYTNGLLTSSSQGNGAQVLLFDYDSASRLTSISITDGNGHTLSSKRYIYNRDGLPSMIITDDDPLATRLLTYQYLIAKDGVTKIPMANTSSLDDHTSYKWGQLPSGGADDTIAVTTSNGGTGHLDYAKSDDLLASVLQAPTGASSSLSSSYTYNSLGLPLTATSGTVHESYGYNSSGMMTSLTDTFSNIWSWTYNGVDLMSSQTPVQAAASVSNSITYGDSVHPHVATATTDALGHTWTYAHNSHGQTVSVTPPVGSASGMFQFAYDETPSSPTLGYPTRMTTGTGDIVTIDSYDPLGDPTHFSGYPDATNLTNAVTTQIAYNANQQPTQVTRSDGKSTSAQYDGDMLSTLTDSAGNLHTMSYFGASRLLSNVSGAYGWSVRFNYDGGGNQTEFIDPLRHSTHYAYGHIGEPTSVTYPDATTASMLYDNNGQVRQTTNGRGNHVDLTYDSGERLHQVTHTTSGEPSLTYSYNTDNTVHQVTDGIGITTAAYLLNGWTSSVTYDYSASGLSSLQTLLFAYYPDGLCQSLTWKSGTTVVGTWTYVYDGDGRPTSVTNSWGETTHWAYDGMGRVHVQNNANGTKTRWCYYDAAGWVNQISHSHGTTPFATYSMTFDGGANTVGMPTTVQELDGSTATYSYDLLYRLTSEHRTGAASVAESFGYDLAGNLTSHNGNTQNYDAANKWLGTSFDADGNQLRVGTLSLAWNDSNELTSAGGRTYGYDAGGRRVISQDSISGKVFSIYVGGVLVGEIKSDGTPIAAYTMGVHGPVSERLLLQNRSLWYHCGPQGETRVLTDYTGAIADTYTYTAYGQPVYSFGGDPNPYRFGAAAGYYTDSVTGLIYCAARWYDPTHGRWLSRDPASYSGGADLYAYCFDNPLVVVDPSGLCGISPETRRAEMTAGVISLVPGAGIFSGAYSTVVAFKGGDYTGAFLSAVSMIPVVGTEADGINEIRLLGMGAKEAGVTRYVAGDANFMAYGDEFYRNAQYRTTLPGYYDVIVHGTPTSVSPDIFGVQTETNAKNFADMIRNQSDHAGEPIRLIACSAGKNPDGFAQQLANELGVPVMAPDDLVYANPFGDLKIGPTRNGPFNGNWVTFTPK